MKFRKAKADDLTDIAAIYSGAKEYMRAAKEENVLVASHPLQI